MEVMFSMGVIMIGLLGVAVLIPAAGRVAQKGNTFDQAARGGMNWVRDFEARGFMQPAAWVLGNNVSSAAYVNDVDAMTGQVTAYAYQKSFCIDPRFAAANGDSYFPYPAATTDARMRRITLRAAPGAAQMTLDQSDELFMGHDDLVFDRPDDPILIPVQVYGQAGGGKRQSEDRLSYLVTVVPKLQGFNMYRDTYTASVVVLKNRDSAMSTASKAPLPDNERFVDVAQFYGAAGGGGDVQVGDVQLRARSGRTAAEAQADLAVHRGDWLMLSGVTQVFNGYNNLGNQVNYALPVFRWYRVVHANEPELNASNEWVVDVTLHGPDWNSNVTNLNSVTGTKATIVTDVVAVYEKTIRAETSSLWVR